MIISLLGMVRWAALHENEVIAMMLWLLEETEQPLALVIVVTRLDEDKGLTVGATMMITMASTAAVWSEDN